MQVLLFATPTLAAVFSFAAYGSAEPDQFTAPHIFSAIAYFSIMRFPLVRSPLRHSHALPAIRELSSLRMPGFDVSSLQCSSTSLQFAC